MNQNGEPIITINGVVLTHAQCAVVHNAVEYLNASLSTLPDPTDDEACIGPALREAFKARIKELQAIMYAP